MSSIEEYKVYDPESATNLYAELQECHKQIPKYSKAYEKLNRIFQKCLNEKTNFSGIRFNGPFAKTDYLLKENHASPYLQRIVNDARVRMRDFKRKHNNELKENFKYDFKAICMFVRLVYKVPIPAVLETVFPSNRILPKGELKADSLRIIVNSWDDTYIYANVDKANTDEIKVFYGGKSEYCVYKNWDWSYLRTILKEGCQLNVIRPREHKGILYPELFIWEPDFLVDISAIANCFESYGATPLNYLLNKIKPSPNTQPIVLGNLAGQFLDEALYPEDCSYEQSIQKFRKRNALTILTAGLGQDFDAEAISQKQNILATLKKKLPEMLHNDGILRFDSSEIMVEPSFFSEMLGIQGRMDFLQLDKKVLIEQKAGKAGFPERNPLQSQEKHYIQLLLYMLLIRYNFYDTYEKNNRELHPYLLYSRYQDGLIRMAFAPELVFAAIKLRNEIVANEYKYCNVGLFELIGLTADSFNERQVQGTLWEHYQKPQIKGLLSSIHGATKLERAYYLRFLKFIETEHLMAKVGNQAKENSGFADKWHSSLEEKQQAGNIYCDLEILSPLENEHKKVERIILGFTEKSDHEISNFRTGDIVILFSYEDGEEPDVRKNMVFRATIESIFADHIILRLRAAQSNSKVFWYYGRRKWAIEHDFFDSSFNSLYRGMQAFLSAPQERRDLLLLQRYPLIDNNIKLIGNYGDFNELVLRGKKAKDLFLIIGPPGTGKTSFGLLNTLQEELLSSDESILLLSYTNRAIDEICGKLKEKDIDFIRIGGQFSCEEMFHPYLLDTKVEQCANIDQLRIILDKTRVFVGTTTAFNSNIHLFKQKQFGLAIIDEASQILEPHLIGLLSATNGNDNCAIRKMILIGDHKQLPAVVQQKEEESVVNESILRDIHLTNCRLSLFERLLKQYRNDRDVTYMLFKQGRMHQDIAQFPNYAFYQNNLKEVPLKHQDIHLPKTGKGKHGIDDLLLTRRVTFVAIPETGNRVSDKVNNNEARAIAATLVRIYRLYYENFDPLKTVGIIVPYRNQISEIRNCVDDYNISPLHDITIDTVERYQGSQRDIIIYGFTIQKYYQLSFLTNNVFEEDGCIIDRKLNVAMTRAREHLLLFGNPKLLANNITFYKLMEFIRSKHGYFNVLLKDYISGRFTVAIMEEDLNLSQATYKLSPRFEKAFEQLVIQPIKLDERTNWPNIIFGRNMQVNLDAIGYGRINFTKQINNISPKEQVLIYCYYIMRMHYCSSKSIYKSYKSWIEKNISACNGRVHFIDFGCGPATCGIAFAEQFSQNRETLQYIGIDVSTEMKDIGDCFLSYIFEGYLKHRSISTFEGLNTDFWDFVSELPSLIIFNLSYVFSNLSSQFTEQLAQMISEIMSRYTLNKYIFIIQHSECDTQLNSYTVFKRIISPHVLIYKKERSAFHYQLNCVEKSKDFYYEILISK